MTRMWEIGHYRDMRVNPESRKEKSTLEQPFKKKKKKKPFRVRIREGTKKQGNTRVCIGVNAYMRARVSGCASARCANACTHFASAPRFRRVKDPARVPRYSKETSRRNISELWREKSAFHGNARRNFRPSNILSHSDIKVASSRQIYKYLRVFKWNILSRASA